MDWIVVPERKVRLLAVDRMITIPGFDRIRTQDPANHLHCRKTQLLAYVGGRTAWTGLLMYRALGDSAAIYRHCYLRHQDRWAFETPYVDDHDLRLLGFEVRQAGKVDLAAFEAGVAEHLAAQQPVLFYAPRHHFPYWVDFMGRVGTVAAEYDRLHSFLVCGAGGSEVLLVDNTSDDHEYFPLTVGWDVLRDGYAKDPDRWFTGCATVREVSGPDLAAFEAGYRAFLAGFDDGFELYDIVGENLVTERASVAETYRAPGVNALALLAGARDMFCRFLAHTAHSERVLAAYARNARLGAVLLDRVSAFHAGLPGLPAERIRTGLAQLRRREQEAARLLLAEAAQLPHLLPAAA